MPRGPSWHSACDVSGLSVAAAAHRALRRAVREQLCNAAALLLREVYRHVRAAPLALGEQRRGRCAQHVVDLLDLVQLVGACGACMRMCMCVVRDGPTPGLVTVSMDRCCAHRRARLITQTRTREEREQRSDLKHDAADAPHVHLVVVVAVGQQALGGPVAAFSQGMRSAQESAQRRPARCRSPAPSQLAPCA